MNRKLALELYELCSAEQPDMERAKELICSGQIDLSAPATPNSIDCFLTQAIGKNNYELAKLLLENGADPNAEAEGYGEALAMTSWSVDLLDEKANEAELLKILQLLLEKGADPNGLKGDEAEWDMLIFDVFNDFPPVNVYHYMTRALIAFVAYGASTDYCSPEVIKALDKNNLEQYRFYMSRHKDGYHLCGVIEDSAGEIVAYI